jgi:hypothetical protein
LKPLVVIPIFYGRHGEPEGDFTRAVEKLKNRKNISTTERAGPFSTPA